MFGQEPRLPVDFLLGRVPDPVGGGIHEWIQEHQTWLQVAFEGARERLRVAAERRKKNYDRHVRDAPLTEGQLVRLHDFSVRGRHKIQDLWGPVVYRIVRTPTGGGSVYTIAPVDDLAKVCQVNRTLLKAVVGAAPSDGALVLCSPPMVQSQSEDDLSGDGDLFVLGHEAPRATPAPTAAVTQTTPGLLLPQSASAPVGLGPSRAPATGTADLPSTFSAVPAIASDIGEGAVRRQHDRLLEC